MDLKKLEMNKCKNDENIPVFLAVIKNDLVQRIRDCGKNVGQTKSGKNIIYDCCNSKYCYLCSEKRKDSRSRFLEKFFEILFSNNFRLVSLTISPFNAYSSKEIEEKKKVLNSSLSKFLRYKRIKDVLIGYIKKYEVAYDKVSKSYNVHLHLLLVFKSGYLSPKYYISEKSFKDMFDKALNRELDYSLVSKSVQISNYKKVSEYFSKSEFSVREKLSKIEGMEVLETIFPALNKTKMFQISRSLSDYKKLVEQELKCDRSLDGLENVQIFVFDNNSMSYVKA